MTTDRMAKLARDYRQAMADCDASRADAAASELIPMLDHFGLIDRSFALLADGHLYWVEEFEPGRKRLRQEASA